MRKLFFIFTFFGLTIFSLTKYFFGPTRELASLSKPEVAPEASTQDHLKEFATYLAVAQAQQQPLGQPSPDPGPPLPPFDQDFLNVLQSTEIRDKLANFKPEQALDMVRETNNLIARLDSENIEEKVRLMRVSFWLEKTFALGESKQFFWDEANRSYGSSNTNEDAFAKEALQYYLDLEIDPETREVKREEFLKDHGVTSPVLEQR